MPKCLALPCPGRASLPSCAHSCASLPGVCALHRGLMQPKAPLPADSRPINAQPSFEILQSRCFQRNVLLHFEVRSYQTTRKSILRLAVHSALIPKQHLSHKEQAGPIKRIQEDIIGCHPLAPQSCTKTCAFNSSESCALHPMSPS